MRYLPAVLLIAALTWAGSELLEVVAGGRTDLTLVLTAAFHLLMAIGIWGAFAGQEGARSDFSRIGAAMISVGYLVLTWMPIEVMQVPGVAIAEFIRGEPAYWLGGILATVGTVLFGSSILRSRSYPAWTGVALVLCPVIFAVAINRSGPEWAVLAANLVQAIAWLAISWGAAKRMSI